MGPGWLVCRCPAPTDDTVKFLQKDTPSLINDLARANSCTKTGLTVALYGALLIGELFDKIIPTCNKAHRTKKFTQKLLDGNILSKGRYFAKVK
uniref:Uncharacterized protein n=1 Tax=Magallana gigas TaxID=29159 RepID=K1QPU3_MAGGI